jgi:hypothetical protein
MRVLTFQNSYNGITTGVSTKLDVIRLLGFPRWKFVWWPVRTLLRWWEPNPRHNGVEIRLSEGDGRVDGIAVRVPGYMDINGIKVGGPWSQLDHLAVKRAGSGWAVDEARGIIYTSVTFRREVDVILLLGTYPIGEDQQPAAPGNAPPAPNNSLERTRER